MKFNLNGAGERFMRAMREERDLTPFIRYEKQDKSTPSKEALAITQLCFELPSIWLDIFQTFTKASIKAVLPKDVI